MLNKIGIFILSWLVLVCPLYAQDTQLYVASESAELNKQVQQLNAQIQELNGRIQKLEKGNYEYVSPKLKDEVVERAHGEFNTLSTFFNIIMGVIAFIIVAITVIATLGGKYFIESKVKSEVETKVMQSIAGEKERFDEAVQNVRTAQQEIESTKERLTNLADNMEGIQYNQVRFILAGSQPNENVAKYLPAKLVLRALEEAEPDDVIIIDVAIYVLGFQKYQDAVPAIAKYLDLDYEYIDNAIGALVRIGTHESCSELGKLLKILFESEKINLYLKPFMITQALGRIGRPEAIPVLEDAVLNHKELDGISAIQQIWGKDAEIALKKILEAIPDLDLEREFQCAMEHQCLEALKTISPKAGEEYEAQHKC